MTEGAYAQGRIFFERDGTLLAQALDIDRARTVGDAIPVASELLAGTNEGSQAFSISEDGTLAYRAGLPSLGMQTQLTWVDRAGRTVGTLGPPGGWFNPELSPDGQRVAVARAMAARPKVILADEPTANLDPAGAADFMERLAALRAERSTTIVLIEHLVEAAWPMADLILALDGDGRPIDFGTPRDVERRSASRLRDAGIWLPGNGCPVIGS